jgi:hypothetical protein
LHLRVDKLTEMLRAAELGRKVCEEYTRKLEVRQLPIQSHMHGLAVCHGPHCHDPNSI